ncbi:hypothetical protein GCM10027422_10850 [Hymenobacter arcticus]
MEQDLFNAAYKNDTAAIKTLIERGSDVNQADDEHVTALYEAVRKGSYEAAELLLQNGADPDKHYNKDEYTVLHIAVANNSKSLTALLLRYTKNANSRDRFGNPPLWTAIHQASLARNNDNAEAIEIVELLLQNGADPYSPNNIGEMVVGKSTNPMGESLSPYDSALRSHKSDLVALIEKYVPKPA